MKKTIASDILAGLTVSFAALSLGAAFGVMSGRGALSGMIGASVIPIVTSLFGGTRIQASGPTAPMTSITAVIVAFAYEKFSSDKMMAEQLVTLTILLSSLFIILSGLLKLGKFIQFVPQSVVLGFMNGIGVLIWVDQIKKLFGIGADPIAGGIWLNVLIALGTLITIYLIPFALRKLKMPSDLRKFFPGILLSIIIYTFLVNLLNLDVAHVELGNEMSSINDYFGLIVSYFPSSPSLYTLETFLTILPFALQLCLLAYLDSLLTSLVIDKLTKERTRANKELIAQGFGNGVSALMHGIPGAQATIRSVLLIKEGAKTRLAGVLVGVFALFGFFMFGKYISLIATSIFTGVLFKAGLDVLDRDFPLAFIKNGWINSRVRQFQAFLVLFTTIVTVLVDLNAAVVSGTILFFVAQKMLGFKDVENDFSEVESPDLMG